tara:strand:+ start:76 stop:387 length:312 start_codon:yes stop_codon:yes gene_type:complete
MKKIIDFFKTFSFTTENPNRNIFTYLILVLIIVYLFTFQTNSAFQNFLSKYFWWLGALMVIAVIIGTIVLWVQQFKSKKWIELIFSLSAVLIPMFYLIYKANS